MSKYFENIIPLELEKISKLSEKRQQATKVFKDMILYSLNKYSIIPTNNFIKSNQERINRNDEKMINECKLIKNENSNLVIAQLVGIPYVIYILGISDLLLLDTNNDSNTIYSLDYIMTYIKENFNIGDTILKEIKKEVFKELSISSYYIEQSKQGLFYTDNINLANQIKDFYKSYQNKALKPDIEYELINTPIDDLKLYNEPKNDNLDYDIKSKNTQENRKENIISEAGPTLTPEKQQDTISYDDYVRFNIDSLNKFVDKYLDNRIEFKMILDSTCLNSLDDTHQQELQNNNIQKAYDYEYLINKIIDNFEAYNEYIKEVIEAEETHIKVIEIKEYHDKELKDNLIKLGSSVSTIDKHLNNKKYNDVPINPKFLDDLVADTSKEVIEGKNIIYKLIDKVNDQNKERTLRKYISMLIIKRQKLNKAYFDYVNKWVLKAEDVDELIRRQDLRDFIIRYQDYINVLIN